MSVERLLRETKKRGLNGVAITDHDTVGCVKRAIDLARDVGVIVIPGIEVTTREAHLLLYGDVEEVPRKFPKGSRIIDVLDYADQNALFSSIAHPYGRLLRPYPVVYMDEVLRRVDAIEVINGRTPSRNNRKAMELALKHNKILTAGSDAHTLEELGSAVILLDEPVSSYEEVIEKLRRRVHKTYGGRPIAKIILSVLKKRIRTILSRQ